MLHLTRGTYLSTTGAQRTFGSARIIETTYTLGQRLPRHAHDHVYMMVMIAGTLRETARGHEHDLSRGHIVFNSAGEGHHDVAVAPGTRCLNIELRPAFLSRLDSEGLRPKEPVVYGPVGPAINAVGRLHSATLDPRADLDVEESLTELIGAAVCTPASPPRDFAWLPRALDFLRATFRRGVLLDDMAAAAGVHRVHLCRSFRTAVGCTIGEYVRRLRADMAHQRITAGAAPLAAIATECGYADQSHMTREVQKHYGRAPARLRHPR